MSENIDYGNLMHDAMRGLIQNVLSQVSKEGLPGEHHFFISFDTSHADVELADWLADRFPSDMTIVIQHWFDALDVTDEGFAITLNFGDNPERMYIPYDAIRTFVDPSVEFGLKFETQDDDDETDTDESPATSDAQTTILPVKKAAKTKGKSKSKAGGKKPGKAKKDDKKDKDAEVVSLDAFRK